VESATKDPQGAGKLSTGACGRRSRLWKAPRYRFGRKFQSAQASRRSSTASADEGALMREPLRVDGLDLAMARSLSERLSDDFRTHAELDPADSCSVEIETSGLLLADLLHRLEEWTTASGLQSIRVNLDGRAYVLEAAAPPTKSGDQGLLPSASSAP
jgi:hypothetical protein